MAEVKPVVMEVGDETFLITQNDDQDDVNTNEVETASDATDAVSVEELDDLPIHFDINFECHLCDKKFSNNIDLRSHLDKDHVSSPEKQSSGGNVRLYEKQTFCTTCCITVNPEDLETHKLSHSGPRKSFHCLTCQAEFKDTASLNRHRRIHAVEKQSEASKGTSKRKPILCTVCGILVNVEDLETHSLIHIKAFQCLTCNAEFSDRKSLEIHKRSHAAEKATYGKTPEEMNVQIKKPSNIGQLQNTKEVKIIYNGFCKLCNLYFSNVETFRGHMKIHGKTIEKKSSNSLITSSKTTDTSSTVECGYCRQMFENIAETRIHLDSACPFCPVNLIQRPSMEMYASLKPDSEKQIFSVVLRDKPVVIKQVEKYRENPRKQSSSVGMTATGALSNSVGIQPSVYANVGLRNQGKSTTEIQQSMYANVGLGNYANTTTGLQPSQNPIVGSGNKANSSTVAKQSVYANVGSGYGGNSNTGIQQTFQTKVGTGNQANRNTGMISLLSENQPITTSGPKKTVFIVPSSIQVNGNLVFEPSALGNASTGRQSQSVAFIPSGNQVTISTGIQPSTFPNISVQNQENSSTGSKSLPYAISARNRNFMVSTSAQSVLANPSTEKVAAQATCTLPSSGNEGNSSHGNNHGSSTLKLPANSSGNSGKAKLKCGYCNKLFCDPVSIRQHQRDEHAMDQLNMACQKDAQTETSRSSERTRLTVGGKLSFNNQVRKRIPNRKKMNNRISERHSSNKSGSNLSEEQDIVIKTEPNLENVEFQKEGNLQGETTCDICFHTFCSVYNVQRHKRLVHSGKKKSPGSNPVGQSHAFPSIRSVLDRDRHCQKSDPNLSQTIRCSHCGKTFAQKKGLRNHQKFHCKVKNIPAANITQSNLCHQCGITFKERRYLNKHHFFNRCKGRMKRAVDVEDIIQCNVCGNTFADESGLRKHKRFHCKGEKAATKTLQNESNSSQLIKCDDCGQTFTLKSSLQRHKLFNRCRNKVSSAEDSDNCDDVDPDLSQVIKCDDCGQTFTLDSSLQRHKLFNRCKNKVSPSEHSDNCNELGPNSSQVIKCDECGQTFTLDSSLQRHKLFNRCKNKLSTSKHSGNCNELGPNSSEVIKCDECGQTFTLDSSLQRHKLFNRCKNKLSTSKHSGNCNELGPNPSEVIKCDECGQTFTLKRSLRKHQRYRCKGEKTTQEQDPNSSQTIKCDECGQIFTLKRSLRKHQRYRCKGNKTTDEKDQNNPQTIKCDDCGRTFTLEKSLRKHQMFHCKGEKSDETDDNCRCKKCGKIFLHTDSLRKHVRYRCKGHLISKSVSFEKSNFCAMCSKTFLHKDSLRKHKLYHCKGKVAQSNKCDEKIECEVCGITYKSKDSLVRHQKFSCQTKEDETRKYVCNCGSSYYSKAVFMRHKKYICKLKSPAKGEKSPAKEKESHEKETEHSCDVCGRVYMHWDSVLRHKKTNCRGWTKCEDCGKACADVERLRQHKRLACLHKTAGTFPCRYCGSSFNHLSNRRRHENNLHIKKNKNRRIRSLDLKTIAKKPKVNYSLNPEESKWVSPKIRKVSSNTSPVVTLDRFLCNLCKESFVTREMLREHKEQHCDAREVEKAMSSPVKQKHFSTNSTPEKSSEFSHILASPQKLVVQLTKIDDNPNQASPGSYKSTEGLCFVCGLDFHRQCKLKIHLQTCLKDDGRSVNPVEVPPVKPESSRQTEGTKGTICDLCGNSYYDHSTMLRHRKKCERFLSMSSKGNGEAFEKSVCENCGNSYYFIGAFTRHKMKCKPSMIGKVVPKLPQVKSGIKKGANQIKCDLCGNSYSLGSSLARHRRKCAALHSKKKRLLMKQKSKPRISSFRQNGFTKCKFCEGFYHPNSLLRHIRNLHGIKMAKTFIGETSRKSASTVIITSDNLFQCDMCDKTFVHRFNVHRHKRISHSTEYKKQLKLRAKAALKAQKFKTSSMSSSKSPVSTKDETISCKFCGKGYSTKFNLMRHVKQAHMKKLHQKKQRENSKTAPKVCNEMKRNLQISQRRKIDINMYESYSNRDKSDNSQNEPTCDVCGAVFMHRKSIKKHMKCFHPEEFIKRNQTSVSKSSDVDELKTHINIEHRKESETAISSPGDGIQVNPKEAGGTEGLEGECTDRAKDGGTEGLEGECTVEDKADRTEGLEGECIGEAEADGTERLEAECKLTPSQDKTDDVTEDSEEGKIMEELTIHPSAGYQPHQDENYEQSSKSIEHDDKIIDQLYERNKDDDVEKNPEQSPSEVLNEDNDSILCKDKEKSVEASQKGCGEDKRTKTEGKEAMQAIDDGIPLCNVKELSYGNQETPSDSETLLLPPNPEQENDEIPSADDENQCVDAVNKTAHEDISLVDKSPHEDINLVDKERLYHEVEDEETCPQHGDTLVKNKEEDNPKCKADEANHEEEDDTPHEEETSYEEEDDTPHEEETSHEEEDDTPHEEETNHEEEDDTPHEEETSHEEEDDTPHEEETSHEEEDDTPHEEETNHEEEDDTPHEEETSHEEEDNPQHERSSQCNNEEDNSQQDEERDPQFDIIEDHLQCNEEGNPQNDEVASTHQEINPQCNYEEDDPQHDEEDNCQN